MQTNDENNLSVLDHENDDKTEFRRSRMRTTMPESIVFLIDLHEEMAEPWNDHLDSRMAAIKDAILKFVRRKNSSPLKHMFALATFNSPDEVSVLVDFTGSEEEMARGVEGLAPEISGSFSGSGDKRDNKDNKDNSDNDGNTKKHRNERNEKDVRDQCDSIDLEAVLHSLCGLLSVPQEVRSHASDDAYEHLSAGGNTSASSSSSSSSSSSPPSSSSLSPQHSCFSPPDRLMRCILVFGRSKQIPAERSKKAGDKDKESSVYIPFLHHPYCYLDILPYSHSTAGQITNLNQFVLETHASAIKLSSHMASLMAHPAQRDEATAVYGRMDMNALLAESIRQSIVTDCRKH